MMTITNPNTAFKTTDNTHRHNHTILHHIGRRLLLLTTLLAMAVGVKAQLADGVYTINNATGGRGTMCYGKYNGTEYFGMANITLGGHTGKSVTVEDVTNKYWYVTTKNGSTYIYNIGKGTFLQTYAQEAATCAADCDRGLILEAQDAYYRIKSGTYNLAFCCYELPSAQMRWLESEEAEATLITFTPVADGLTAYKTQVDAANDQIEDVLGFLPKKSNETVSYSYRIVNTRRHVDNSDTRYIYPLTESGTYGRRLKMTSTSNTTSTSEQYWYLLDAGDEYYYIVNRATGAYLYRNTTAAANQQIELSATHRTRFKLETSTYQSGGINYKSYNILPEPSTTDSFNPHGGPDGYISVYGKGDGGSHWFFVDEAEFTRCNAPEISLTGQNITIEVPSVPSECTVYYTTDGSVPSATNGTALNSTSSFSHDGLTTGSTILAVTTKTGQYNSVIAAKALTASPMPNFSFNGDFSKVILKCTNNNATIYYTTNGDTPSYSSESFTSSKEFSVEDFEGKTLKAFTLLDGHLKSAITEFRVKMPQAINSAEDFEKIKTDLAGAFYLTQVITLPDNYESIEKFTGTFDGGFHTINGLNKPLFTTTNGAIIKNVVIKEVQISGGTGDVGAIVGTAQGKTRIYNCGILSGSVGGGTNVGGIAGRIEDASRVINCYSFANITGGTTVGGIVGNNAVASTAGNLQTLVMNCMFYGDITEGTNVYPIYGGEKISNKGAAGDANGINNYNYYRYEAKITPKAFNCALAAEERYLTRFEFYRHVLNSQRKLCAFYVTGDVNDYAEIAKWVFDTGDPVAPKYPILKPWGEYASIMNRAGNNKSGNKLSVIIGGTNAMGETISATTELDITNADPDTYDYNHYKVQLPYYNEFFDDNYTNNMVVTGWKITEVTTDGTVTTYNSFSTTGDNRYNFADRYCTDKDLYQVSKRVFAQGGNYNVPEGVESIKIEPYWGKAVYLSDRYYDVVYLNGTAHGFTPAGETASKYKVEGQTVYKTLAEAWTNLDTSASTVYDNAIVLVGNYHSFDETWSNGSTPFTVMSVDENNDKEPDYGLYCRTSGRLSVNPIRFDFLNHVGVGMAAKEDGRSAMYNLAIWEMKGWFEITETALAIYEEFEYDASAEAKVSSPLILNGGIFAQFGSTAFRSHTADKTPYTIVGGNCYFKNYSPGCNTNTSTPTATKFPPVSILGGEYEQFYLSGGNPAPTPYAYNALCYGNGGKIGTFAGAYQEAINGDVFIKFDHMLVDEFYGGGVNEKKPITGSINITINNSRVGLYCGGPKFGNIQADKTVTTYAENTIFDSFFGGGYGGTSLFRGSNSDSPSGSYPTNWFTTYFANRRGNYYAGTETLESRFTPEGILVSYETEFFSYAGGGSTNARFYTDYAALSVAEVRNVTSHLKGCTIKGDLYGGGNLGKANGNISTTLENCKVEGSVFAGGFSAAVPTCKVMPETAPTTYASYNSSTGIFTPTKYHTPDIYTWAQADATLVHGQKYIDDTKKLIYTKAVDLSDLGTVRGNTSIVIMGASEIEGSVFGGGNASKVIGNTHVHIQGGTIDGNVFGAGNQAEVTGKTEVVIGE